MAGLYHQLMGLARALRRRTLLGPLLDAWSLRAVVAAIDADPRAARVIGPEEFSPYLRGLTPLVSACSDIPAGAGEWVIVTQGGLASLPRPLLHVLRDGYHCVSANRRYILFRSGAASSRDEGVRLRLDALLAGPAGSDLPPLRTLVWRDRAILLTTFNRPAAVERSLPQLTRLGARVLVVDDGSRLPLAGRNQALAHEHGAEYLRLPSNHGISAALTVGLEYLLADRRLDWISCFQDDVDVQSDAMKRLQRVEDARARPVLTGYDADEHPALDVSEVAGEAVRLKRETAGVHLHAHRDYWRGVLPIPTEYVGAPKRRWEASLEDSWITVGAPGAAARRGIPVVCIPGLVRTFLWHPGDSTWGNPNEPEAARVRNEGRPARSPGRPT
jgi:hypothetical protein